MSFFIWLVCSVPFWLILPIILCEDGKRVRVKGTHLAACSTHCILSKGMYSNQNEKNMRFGTQMTWEFPKNEAKTSSAPPLVVCSIAISPNRTYILWFCHLDYFFRMWSIVNFPPIRLWLQMAAYFGCIFVEGSSDLISVIVTEDPFKSQTV